MHNTCNKTQRCKTRIWQPVQSHVTAAAAKPSGSRLLPYRTRAQQAHQLRQDPLLIKPHTLNYTRLLYAAGPQTAHFRTQSALEVHAKASGTAVRPDGHNICATQHQQPHLQLPCSHSGARAASTIPAVQPHSFTYISSQQTQPSPAAPTLQAAHSLARTHNNAGNAHSHSYIFLSASLTPSPSCSTRQQQLHTHSKATTCCTIAS
jgi:hypothetical protein